MRRICIINQKGGVAKTTTAINLAAGLALRGKKTLILDLDPQGQVSTYFPSTEYKKNMFEFLTNGAEVAECICNIGKNLDVIKSGKEMRGAEAMLYKREDGAAVLYTKLQDFNSYDYVIMDCPPSVGVVSQNAMLYADEAIIPTSSDPLGMDGLRKIMTTIKEFSQHSGHNLKVSKIVPTLFDTRNKICKTTLNEMRNEYYELVAEPVRINSKIKEAPKAKKSIFTYAPSSAGSKDYKKLVDTIINDEPLKSRAAISEAQNRLNKVAC